MNYHFSGERIMGYPVLVTKGNPNDKKIVGQRGELWLLADGTIDGGFCVLGEERKFAPNEIKDLQEGLLKVKAFVDYRLALKYANDPNIRLEGKK